MTDDLPASLSYRLDGPVAVVTLDDGKANATGPAEIAGLAALLARAEREATALVVAGNARVFSAGFDLAVMTESVTSMRSLVTAGGRMWMGLYGSPLPTVSACTGHALAGGAVTLLSTDERIGPSDAPAKVGLSEVAIGMPLPEFVVALARERLSPRHLTRAVLGTVFTPAEAVEVGYLDRLVPQADVVESAVARAHELAALAPVAVGRTKTTLRRPTIDGVLGRIDDDMATIVPPNPGG
ncbi:MAG: crotonase/enoyl-CoA hydratase family protein [Acidimicrobiales bacterium]|nr:crotonase/enoyl-CoA hydratase family protein [Acidimicrobiales bacterium]